MVQAREVVFGRTRASTVQVVHPLVSRRHARLLVEPTGLLLEDLGSANGTWLNGVRCKGRTRVIAGDELSFGREGASFVLVRATLDGRDVSVDGEDDQKTLVAGDPRALRVAARVAVSPSALPEPPEIEEEPEVPTRPAGPGDLERTRAAAPHERVGRRDPDAPTVAAGSKESSIPVIDEYVSDSEFHDMIEHEAAREPATIPVERPGPAGPPKSASNPPERPRSTPKTEPIVRAPATEPAAPPPATVAEEESPRRRETRGRTAGLLIGLLLGIVAAAAAAVYTDLPERLAEFDLQQIDLGGPK